MLPISKRIALSDIAARREQLRKGNHTLVFTNGCFDLLHVGHVYALEKAKKANPLQLIAAANAALSNTATSLNTGELFLLILRAKTMDLTESTGFPSAEDRIFATINSESCVVPYYLTTNVRNLHMVLFGQEDYEPSSTVYEINDVINSYVQ